MKTKLKNYRIGSIIGALMALDGRQEPVEISDNKGVTRKAMHLKPYVYEKAGVVRLSIARNLRALKPLHADLEETRQKLLAGFSANKAPGTALEGAELATFFSQYNPVLNAEVEVELYPLPISDADIQFNALPTDALEALLDLIELSEAK